MLTPYAECQAEIEHEIDKGSIHSLEEAEGRINAFVLDGDEKSALTIWAWAWLASKPRSSRRSLKHFRNSTLGIPTSLPNPFVQGRLP